MLKLQDYAVVDNENDTNSSFIELFATDQNNGGYNIAWSCNRIFKSKINVY